MDSSQKPSPKLKYYNISLVQCKTKRQKYEFIKLLSTACHALLSSTVHRPHERGVQLVRRTGAHESLGGP